MILKFQDFLFELGDSLLPPYDWKCTQSDAKEYQYEFNTEDLTYWVYFSEEKPTIWEVFFSNNGIHPDSNKGHQFKIMATLISILKDFAKNVHPDTISIHGIAKQSGEKGTYSRSKFYREYLSKNVPNGYQFVDRSSNAMAFQKVT
jgi:hypothetical protein